MQEDGILKEIEQGRLAHVLDKIPLEEWKRPNNLYMWRAAGNPKNAKAIAFLLRQGASISSQNGTYLHAHFLPPGLYEIFCANATTLSLKNFNGETPIDNMLKNGNDGYARILIKHGARIRGNIRFVSPRLLAYQNGILNCRSATIAIIQLKRHLKVDKFLFLYMARSVWATRSEDDGWISKSDLASLKSIDMHNLKLSKLKEQIQQIKEEICDEERAISACALDIFHNNN